MLVVSVLEWLHDAELSNIHLDDLVKTIFSISKSINTMVNNLCNNRFQDVMFPPLPPNRLISALSLATRNLLRYPFYAYGDNVWRELLRQKVPFTGPEKKYR